MQFKAGDRRDALGEPRPDCFGDLLCPAPQRKPILAALRLATEGSYACQEIEEGLAIEVYDEEDPVGLGPSGFDERQAAFRERLGWDDDDQISYSVSTRRHRDRTQSFPSLAPLTLLPFSVETTTGLVLGRYDIVTALDVPRLERRFAEHGIEAEIARGDDAGERFLTARRDNAKLTVPASVREQISVGLMTIDALIEMVDWTLGVIAPLDTDSPQNVHRLRGRGELLEQLPGLSSKAFGAADSLN